jgi:hypothetical protein
MQRVRPKTGEHQVPVHFQRLMPVCHQGLRVCASCAAPCWPRASAPSPSPGRQTWTAPRPQRDCAPPAWRQRLARYSLAMPSRLVDGARRHRDSARAPSAWACKAAAHRIPVAPGARCASRIQLQALLHAPRHLLVQPGRKGRGALACQRAAATGSIVGGRSEAMRECYRWRSLSPPTGHKDPSAMPYIGHHHGTPQPSCPTLAPLAHVQRLGGAPAQPVCRVR